MMSGSPCTIFGRHGKCFYSEPSIVLRRDDPACAHVCRGVSPLLSWCENARTLCQLGARSGIRDASFTPRAAAAYFSASITEKGTIIWFEPRVLMTGTLTKPFSAPAHWALK